MAKRIKKIKEIQTVQLPKPEAPEGEAGRIIGALASLQASEGWAIMVKILNDNIAYLEKAILDKIDPSSKQALSDAEVEVARTKRDLNIEVRDTPQNYTKVVKEIGTEPPDYDPYFKTNADILKARATPPGDDRGK